MLSVSMGPNRLMLPGVISLVSLLVVIVAACSAGAPAGAPASPATVKDIVTYSGPDRQQKLEAAAKQEGQLVWYTSLTISVAESLARAFEAKYQPIKVEIFRAADADITTKITEESKAGKNVVDVVETPSTALRILKEGGHFTEYYLPNADAYPAEGKEAGSGKNVLWVVAREHYVGFGYNKDLVEQSALPKDVNGLLAPALKNKMAIPGTSTGVNFVGNLVTHQSADFVAKLAQQGIKVQMISGTALMDLIAKGEVAASPATFKAEALIASSKGAPVGWIPLEPVTANAGGVAISARAPHPNAAALFAQFLLGEDGQRIFKENNFGSAGVDPGFKRWYPDQGLTAAQYEEKYSNWQKLMNESFVRPG